MRIMGLEEKKLKTHPAPPLIVLTLVMKSPVRELRCWHCLVLHEGQGSLQRGQWGRAAADRSRPCGGAGLGLRCERQSGLRQPEYQPGTCQKTQETHEVYHQRCFSIQVLTNNPLWCCKWLKTRQGRLSPRRIINETDLKMKQEYEIMPKLNM